MKKSIFALFLFFIFVANVCAEGVTPDIQISNIYVDNNEVEQMPKKEEGYYFKTASCTNGVKATFDENNWELTLNGISTTSSCKVYFTSSVEEKAKDIIPNPDTGAFANGVLITIGILTAIIISAYIIRKKKFYRI